jgi:hypothetical protein
MAFAYVKRTSEKAKNTPGESFVAKGEKPKLGTGKRFAALKTGLAKKGATNPGALAAWIGRKKFGSRKMVQMAVKRRMTGK